MKRQLTWFVVLLAMLAAMASTPAWARNGCGCASCAGCDCGTVTRTVYVPECTTEMRTVTRTRYHLEPREKTITVFKQVPITEEKTCTYTVLVPETHIKTVTHNVCRPVWETLTREYTVQVPYTEPVEQKYTVCVPYTERVDTTRKVLRWTPVTTMKTVTICTGHWETHQEEVACGCGGCGCGACGECGTRTICRRVWVPLTETRQVPCTTYQCTTEEVPCTYTVCKMRLEERTRTCNVTRWRPETRTCEYKVCKYVTEPQTKEVQYTVCKPEQRTRTYTVCRYECQPEEKTVTYSVCVPETYSEEVPVTVRRMVCKTIEVPARGGGGWGGFAPDGCGCGCP